MAYVCPYCKIACRDDGKIEKRIYESYEHSGICNVLEGDSGSVVLTLSKCPDCGKVAVGLLSGFQSKERITPYSYPPKNAMVMPEYIPNAVQADYIEALAIVNSSPKASATLARRCLQGMIHDFWGVKEKNLNAEITALKNKVPTAQWNAMDALRKIGNIGAHMENDINIIVDVDPDEASSLIKLIELLIGKWYISRHDEENLLAEIESIGNQKEADRQSGVSGANCQ